MRCGLAWECPVCRSSIQSERAGEVMETVNWHRKHGGETYLLTLTVRHGLGDDLKRMREGVANAWRKVQAGRQWIEWRERVGLVGTVRALEVTHGRNGWHPHIHVLILAKGAPDADVDSWRAQLSARWQRAVESALGSQHRPNDRRGCDLRVSRKADYIAKLGLEIAGSSAKDARSENRAPLEIAHDYAAEPNLADAALWRAYAKGMKRARMLTWSKGLRARVGLGRERTDQEIIDDDEGVVFVGIVHYRAWDRLARIPGAALQLLETVERHGFAAGEALLDRLLSQRAPP